MRVIERERETRSVPTWRVMRDLNLGFTMTGLETDGGGEST